MKYKAALNTILLSFALLLFSNLSTRAEGSSTQQPLLYTLLFLFRSVIGMLIIPLLYIKFVFKKPIREFGFRLPVGPQETFALTATAVLVSLPFLVLFSDMKQFSDLYLFGSASFYSKLFQVVVLSFIYYFAEEFIFRGFMLFRLHGLLGSFGLVLTNFIFAIFHLGKPMPEVAFAFLSGIIFSLIVIKSKSFIPAAVAHYVIALILNVLINWRS